MVVFQKFSQNTKTFFCVYLDLETSQIKLPPDETSKNTTKIAKHEVIAIGYFITSTYKPELNKYKDFHGENLVENFLNNLIEDCKNIFNEHVFKSYPISLSEKQELDFQNATNCFLCKDKFKKKERKIRHHDHWKESFNFIGALHNSCNLLLKKPYVVTWLFHNLAYDMGFILREILRCPQILNFEVIGESTEKIIAMFFYIKNDKGKNFQVRILDTYRFAADSLENLTKNLPKDRFSEFDKHINSPFSNLLHQKSFFPYEFIDNEEKLKLENLPSIENFYSSLKNETISPENYEHAKQVFLKFNCSNILQYLLLYLKTDCLLLMSCFEFFREFLYQHFELEVLSFVTIAGYSYEAFLKNRNVTLLNLKTIL